MGLEETERFQLVLFISGGLLGMSLFCFRLILDPDFFSIFLLLFTQLSSLDLLWDWFFLLLFFLLDDCVPENRAIEIMNISCWVPHLDSRLLMYSHSFIIFLWVLLDFLKINLPYSPQLLRKFLFLVLKLLFLFRPLIFNLIVNALLMHGFFENFPFLLKFLPLLDPPFLHALQTLLYGFFSSVLNGFLFESSELFFFLGELLLPQLIPSSFFVELSLEFFVDR